MFHNILYPTDTDYVVLFDAVANLVVQTTTCTYRPVTV